MNKEDMEWCLGYLWFCLISMVILAVLGAPLWLILLTPLWMIPAIVTSLVLFFIVVGLFLMILLALLTPIILGVFVVCAIVMGITGEL